MPKRKQSNRAEDAQDVAESGHVSDEGVAPSKSTPTVKKVRTSDPTKSAASTKDREPGSQEHIDLGKKKRVSVTNFKGSLYVDIREFYGDEGDEKPGKKGIALSLDQWETLKANLDKIDAIVSQAKK